MPLANPTYRPEQLTGHRPCDQPRRAERYHGPVSAAKRLARAVSRPDPLPQSADVLVLNACLPIRTVNDLNAVVQTMGGKFAQQNRHRKEKNVTYFVLSILKPLPLLPWRVTLTRCGRNKRKMDEDGLMASLKHVRDSIAECAGVDDGNRKQIEFVYAQEYDAGGYSVRVRIERVKV
jgi:hypothetical protein